MRLPHLALGLVVAFGACGGAGEESAVRDTAGLETPAVAQPEDPARGSPADSLPAPAAGTGQQSSGDEAPARTTLRTPAAPIAGADTAAGVVSLLGTAASPRIVVQTSTGPIGVEGDLAQTLRRLEGMEVWVQGPLSTAMGRVIPPRQITVQRFEVRGIGGVPAIDGVLREEAGTLVIVSAGGERTRLATPPVGLRELVGRRIWVTRAQDGAVASFGAIE
jgi:hypothetical protein